MNFIRQQHGGMGSSRLRVNGISGSVKVDAQRKRVYLADVSTPRLLVLDMTTGALIADMPLPRICTLAAFDAETDLAVSRSHPTDTCW